MLKLVFNIRRRSDIEPEEFYRYWKDEHGPLVRSVAEVLGIRRYVQSHTIDTPINDALRASRNTEPRYDGVAELWWDSVDDFVGRLADPAAQAASAALLEDEGRFIDLAATSIFLTEEHEIIAFDASEARARGSPRCGSATRRSSSRSPVHACQPRWLAPITSS